MIVDSKRHAQPRPSAAGLARQRTVERLSVPARAALVLVACLALGGCSVLDKPVRAAVYDFGPGALAPAAPTASAALPALTLAEVDSGSALDSTAVLYRLVYANAQQLLPYSQARWSMPPAQLLRQRVRETLGQHRTVLAPGDGSVAGSQPAMLLRIELEEFSQLFEAPAKSVGLLRLRATLVQPAGGGDKILGQRMVVVQRPAPSADAPGAVRALTDASVSAAEEIDQWLNQFR